MINTLTLNPAIDRVLYLKEFERNVTNRVEKTCDVIGGKGTHVSINLKLLGMDSRAFGIGYGDQGRRIMDILESHAVQVEFIHREEHNNRTNYLLVEDNNDCTIIAEKGVQLSELDILELIDLMTEKTKEGDYLVLSGDASNSPDPFIYNTIMEALCAKKMRVFLDTSGATLKQGLSGSPFLIKPNLDELSFLCDRKIACTESDVLLALESIEKHGIEIVAVSLGGDGSIVKSPEGVFRVVPPKVDVRNTIGCGDSFLAGLVFGFHAGLSMEDTLRRATAISAATAESSFSVGFDAERAESLLDRCTIRKIG